MTKSEKYIATGAVVLAGVSVAYLCPPLAPPAKVAAMATLRNILR